MDTRDPDHKIALCESIIQYIFTDRLRCFEALKTSENAQRSSGPAAIDLPSNKRLAIVGDVVAQGHLCRKWYKSKYDRGDWSAIERELLSNAKLSTLCRTTGLASCIMLDPSATRVEDSMMATTVEAILGAVYLDGGDRALAEVMGVLGLDEPLHLVLVRSGSGSLEIPQVCRSRKCSLLLHGKGMDFLPPRLAAFQDSLILQFVRRKRRFPPFTAPFVVGSSHFWQRNRDYRE